MKKSSGGWIKGALALAAVVLIAAVVMELLGATAPKPRPSIAGTDLTGKTWALDQHLGKRAVLVNFFSTT